MPPQCDRSYTILFGRTCFRVVSVPAISLGELRQRMVWPQHSAETLPTGTPELARLLPAGHRTRTVVEWIGTLGSGAGTLALRAALVAAGERPLALIGGGERCFPPALAELGLPLERAMFVIPRTPREFAWAVEEAMRCPALGAVVAWPERVSERAYRRWQLAAGQGCRLGVLVRDRMAENAPCWAAVRWRVEAAPGPPRQALVTLVRSWGQGRVGGSVQVQVDGETMAGGMVSELADPAPPRRAAGA